MNKILWPVRMLYRLIALIVRWLPFMRYLGPVTVGLGVLWLSYALLGYDGFAAAVIGTPVTMVVIYLTVERVVWGHWFWQLR